MGGSVSACNGCVRMCNGRWEVMIGSGRGWDEWMGNTGFIPIKHSKKYNTLRGDLDQI